MKKILSVISFTTGVILISMSIMELTSMNLYGKWLDDDKYLPVVKKLLAKGENDLRIIYTGMGSPYISKMAESPFTQYAIEGYGEIPRWSEMHTIIKQWIDSADKSDLLKLQKVIQ